MKLFLYLLLVLVLSVAYSLVSFYQKLKVSKVLVEQTKPFSKETSDFSNTLLVLGDSTAVGVGATRPQDSIAALLAFDINATYIENLGVSGAVLHALNTQLEKVKRKEYDHILIQIGGNDITHFHNAKTSAQALGQILSKLPKSNDVTVICCGNIGTSGIMPYLIRPFYTTLSLSYHKEFADTAKEHKALYVNLYDKSETDPYLLQPEIYLAKDEFHPSTEGYSWWFKKIKKARSNTI